MAISELNKAFKKIASSWPSDPVYPNMQLRNFLMSLADHPNLTSEAIRATQALSRNELQHKVRILSVQIDSLNLISH